MIDLAAPFRDARLPAAQADFLLRALLAEPGLLMPAERKRLRRWTNEGFVLDTPAAVAVLWRCAASVEWRRTALAALAHKGVA